MNINTEKLLNNIKNIKNIANLKFLICNEILFSKEGLFKNIGFYIIGIIIIFHIINMILFYMKLFDLLKNKIKEIIYAIKSLKVFKKIYKKKRKKEKQENNENEIKLEDINNINNNVNEFNIEIKKNKKRNKSFKRKKKHIEIYNNSIIENNNINNILNINMKKIKQNENDLSENKSLSKDEKEKEIMKYIDDEINTLSYDLALQCDTRTYFQYYISLLKTKHSFIFSFFYNKDYNSKIIKIDLYCIGFIIYYTVNALFYNDNTMHNIYINNGSFDIEYKLPKIIYSSLISMVINTLLKMLALSNNSIIEFKQIKKRKGVNERGDKLNYKLNIKFVLYFIISFIFLLFFWYYLSMFGAIYKNTQYHLLKDTLISFAISQIYPFGIYLIPGFFRIPSLSGPYKKRKEYLYKLSKILQML